MNLENVLSGNGGPEGIRHFLASPAARRALRCQLSALSSVPAALGTCHLQFVRFRLRPEAKLLTSFLVDLRGTGSDGKGGRPVAVTWKPRWIGLVRLASKPEDIQMEDEAERRGVALPFRRLVARVPAWGMRIRVSPLDPVFPQLVRVSDPAYVSRMLATICTAPHLMSGPLPEGRYRVTSVRYVPEQRHVLRYDALDSARRATVYAKLYKHGRAGRFFDVANRVAETLRSAGKEIAGLPPLGYVPDDDVVLYPALSGQPLHLQLAAQCRELGRALDLAGRALRALHESAASFARSLPLHTFEDEVEDVAGKSDAISLLMPTVGLTIAALLDRARELQARLPQEPPTVTHGDVKAEHFWASPEGVTLMDADFCRRADPAVDLGQFLAELRLWYDIYGQDAVAGTQERFLAGYSRGVPQHRVLRARLYESLELIKATVRRVPISDRDWESRIVRMVSRASSLLEGLEANFG